MKVMRTLLNKVQLFLGTSRLWLLIGLFIGTGILSAVFGKIEGDWVTTAQTVLVLSFLAIAVVVVLGRMEGDTRYRWGAILAPAIGILGLAALFFPQYVTAALGAAVGWIVAGIFIFSRSREPLQYKEAIRAFRKNDYETAVKAMDAIIKTEPKTAHHYRFRAEILRVWEKYDRAHRDYEMMVKLAPDDVTKAVAYNGLAEVDLQVGKLDSARKAAQQAYDLAPDEWVAAYNLGMIQDRQGDSSGAIASLSQALKAKIPDARHRLLIYLYLARAYSRQGDTPAAEQAIASLKKQKNGLREWETIMQSDQAQTLRDVMAQDIETARKLVSGALGSAALANEGHSA
jgi:tetratricopeptide (TPR) repeat protein